jgi:hypothetical protein
MFKVGGETHSNVLHHHLVLVLLHGWQDGQHVDWLRPAPYELDTAGAQAAVQGASSALLQASPTPLS